MPAVTIPAAPSRRTPTRPIPGPTTGPVPSLAHAVAAASDVALSLPLDSPRWDHVGPALTAFLDAARREADGPRSPIEPDEHVAAVLRLRDLARLARTTVSLSGRRRPAPWTCGGRPPAGAAGVGPRLMAPVAADRGTVEERTGETEPDMALHIELLGPPRASRDGHPVDGIRGTKAWALLAYLLRAEAPVARRRVASMLFPDAADPAAALRWNLSQLRRHLGLRIDGDPITVTLPDDAQVDLHVLAHGDAVEAASVAAPDRELLEGVTVDHEAWQVWLAAERRHMAGLAGDVLREAAVGHLSRGDAGRAVELAERVVALDPYDENAAVLLARSLRDAGRLAEARAVVDATTTRLRDELGVEPSPALRSVAHASVGGAVGIGGRTAVEAQLEAGEAALAAGVPDAGIDALREALGGSRAIGEPDLLARSLTALGSALIHAVRGTDQDALALLQEAVPVALAEALPAVAARASRELGYVDMLRGRYERAERWFGDAARHAAGLDDELAWIRAFAGATRTDVGDTDGAAALLDEAVGRAAAGEAPRAAASALAWRGRLRLLADDVDGASADLDRSVAMTSSLGLRAFRPWPDSMRAELSRHRGDLDEAAAILDRTLATGRQVGDPCWESMALRGLGLVAVARGDVAGGLDLLEQAPRQCRRLPDTYLWIEVYGLDALADVTSHLGLPDADRWVEQLAAASARHGMRPLREHATEYRRRLDAGTVTPAPPPPAPARR